MRNLLFVFLCNTSVVCAAEGFSLTVGGINGKAADGHLLEG